MEQSAVVYLVNAKIIVAPVVRTTAGVGLEIDPTLSLALPEELIPKVLRALEKSTIVVAHPTQSEWKGFFKPFQNIAQVRSHRAFMANAKQISIELVGDQIRIIPQRNLGGAEGFEPMADSAVLVPVANVNEAASELIRLLG